MADQGSSVGVGTLDYQIPPRASAFRVLYLAQAVTMLVLAGAAVGYTQWLVPGFAGVFADFRTELPTLTEWLMRWSGFLSHVYGWGLIVPLAAIGAFPLAHLCREGTKTREIVVTLLLSTLIQLVLFLLYAGAVWMALQLPMLHLMRALDGGSPP